MIFDFKTSRFNVSTGGHMTAIELWRFTAGALEGATGPVEGN